MRPRKTQPRGQAVACVVSNILVASTNRDHLERVQTRRQEEGPRRVCLVSKYLICLAGAGGFEPPYGGIKIRCLATWLRPNRLGRLTASPSLGNKTAGELSPCWRQDRNLSWREDGIDGGRPVRSVELPFRGYFPITSDFPGFGSRIFAVSGAGDARLGLF